MRSSMLTFVRFGPTWVYAVAAVFVASIILLESYPGSPFAWALYLTFLPLMREPVFLLLDIPGVEVWAVVAAFTLTATFGAYISTRPEQFLRTRFIHSHSALAVLLLANAPSTTAHMGFGALPLPKMSHWSLVPATDTVVGAALIGLAALACLSSHVAMIRSVCRKAHNSSESVR